MIGWKSKRIKQRMDKGFAADFTLKTHKKGLMQQLFPSILEAEG